MPRSARCAALTAIYAVNAARAAETRTRAALTGAPRPLLNAAVRSAASPQPTTAETIPAATSASTSTARASASVCTHAGAGVRRPPVTGGVPSSSLAAASPPRGTSTSRGPAARKSGTSKPPERRASDGIPASSSSPCTSSASGWFCAVATRTGSPSAYGGWILRARTAASSSRGCGRPGPGASTNGEPQREQNRSCDPPPAPHPGHTSGSDMSVLLDVERRLGVPPIADRPGADVVAVGVLDTDDQVDGVGQERAREVDVGRRRNRVRARVRVVDDAHLELVAIDLVVDPLQIVAVDVVRKRARARVARLVQGDCLPVAAADDAAALVRRLVARLGDYLVEQRAGDPQALRCARRPSAR